MVRLGTGWFRRGLYQQGTCGARGVGDPADAGALAEPTERHPADLAVLDPAVAAGLAGQPMLLDQVTEATLAGLAHQAEHLEARTALKIGSAMVTPLAGRSRMLGSSTLASHQSGRYTEPDLASLSAASGGLPGRSSGPDHSTHPIAAANNTAWRLTYTGAPISPRSIQS